MHAFLQLCLSTCRRPCRLWKATAPITINACRPIQQQQQQYSQSHSHNHQKQQHQYRTNNRKWNNTFEWFCRLLRFRLTSVCLLASCQFHWSDHHITDDQLMQTVNKMLSYQQAVNPNPDPSTVTARESTAAAAAAAVVPASSADNASPPPASTKQQPTGIPSSRPVRKRRPIFIWESQLQKSGNWEEGELCDFPSLERKRHSHLFGESYRVCEDYRDCNMCNGNSNGSQEVVNEWPVFVDNNLHPWELVVDNKENMKMYRRPSVEYPGLYEYLTQGSYSDISARAFYEVQRDLAHRKHWDTNVVEITILDTDEDVTNTELVFWRSHFPYRMANRVYVYVRRSALDVNGKMLVLVNRGCDIELPPTVDANKAVRVTDYVSNSLIIPHTTMDRPGCDFYLFYVENPQVTLQSVFYKWAASSAVPSIVDNIHKAAKDLEVSGYIANLPSDSANTICMTGSVSSSSPKDET